MSAAKNPDASINTFEKFVAAINAHDVEALTSLMSADHLFVDSLGNQVRGAQTMQACWSGYFAMCPDYAITISQIAAAPEVVLATGKAGGTIDNSAWKTPAAWQAKIRDGHVAEWRVFADNKPVYEILAGRTR